MIPSCTDHLSFVHRVRNHISVPCNWPAFTDSLFLSTPRTPRVLSREYSHFLVHRFLHTVSSSIVAQHRLYSHTGQPQAFLRPPFALRKSDRSRNNTTPALQKSSITMRNRNRPRSPINSKSPLRYFDLSRREKRPLHSVRAPTFHSLTTKSQVRCPKIRTRSCDYDTIPTRIR